MGVRGDPDQESAEAQTPLANLTRQTGNFLAEKKNSIGHLKKNNKVKNIQGPPRGQEIAGTRTAQNKSGGNEPRVRTRGRCGFKNPPSGGVQSNGEEKKVQSNGSNGVRAQRQVLKILNPVKLIIISKRMGQWERLWVKGKKDRDSL